jgi:hypothetical protein
MAAVEVGGTPPPLLSLVPLLDHETGKVNFLDVHTGELVDGATLNHYPTKNIDKLVKIAGTTLSPLSPSALKIQV